MTTAEALSTLQQKEEEKRRKEVITEARGQKKFQKQLQKILKN